MKEFLNVAVAMFCGLFFFAFFGLIGGAFTCFFRSLWYAGATMFLMAWVCLAAAFGLQEVLERMVRS